MLFMRKSAAVPSAAEALPGRATRSNVGLGIMWLMWSLMTSLVRPLTST